MGALAHTRVAAVVAAGVHHRRPNPFLPNLNTNGVFKELFEEWRYFKCPRVLGKHLAQPHFSKIPPRAIMGCICVLFWHAKCVLNPHFSALHFSFAFCFFCFFRKGSSQSQCNPANEESYMCVFKTLLHWMVFAVCQVFPSPRVCQQPHKV